MGLEFSCPGSETNALEEGFCSIANSGLLSVNHHRADSKAKLLNAFGSGKFVFEGSLSFKRKEPNPFCLETEISMKSSNAENSEIFAQSNSAKRTRLNEEEPASPKHDAAIKLQKVYKSFRTRRQLADCAVLVEQKWWKLLDFALLKRSSVSFFDIDKPESAVSKWSRARTRAAKVGKGLSKNSKAQKLALQHWLEAIDPRHRYGHNLHFYYDSWLLCESKQPFFYWLDVGEGKEVNLEACPRLKLQQQCIKYLGPKEREAYEVIVEEGRLIYKKSRETLDTTGGLKDAKWIFVLSTSKNLYVGLKKKGRFQHSSFLAGGATSAAGQLVVENGVLKAVWPHSGHYRPTEENFEEFMSFLEENNVALTDVKKSPDEDDEEWVSVLRSRDSESDLTSSSIYTESKIRSELLDSLALDGEAVASKDLNSAGQRDQAELMKLYVFDGKSIISDEQTSEEEEEEEEEEDKGSNSSIDSNQTYKTNKCLGDEPLEISSPSKRPLIFHKPNLFIEEKEEGESDELIIKRISSTKALKQSQLETKLPFKWTTGTGARIGYVRNYPSELQFRALEQVNLSPRGLGISRPFSSPRATPSPRPRAQEFERDYSSTKTILRDSSL